MSWVVKALSISNPEKKQKYASVDILGFHEWSFNQFVPKGSSFSNHLPKSQDLLNGNILIACTLSEDEYVTENGKNILNQNIPIERAKIIAGSVLSPNELLTKYTSLVNNFNNNIKEFKNEIQFHQFFTSKGEESKLYKINSWDDKEANVTVFGFFKQIVASLNECLDSLQNNLFQKIGKSYELETLKKFETYIHPLNQGHYEKIDATKLNFLLNTAKINSKNNFFIDWKDLFLKSSDTAQLDWEKIQHFQKFSWVKMAINQQKNKGY